MNVAEHERILLDAAGMYNQQLVGLPINHGVKPRILEKMVPSKQAYGHGSDPGQFAHLLWTRHETTITGDSMIYNGRLLKKN